jgi:DNA-binding MarR family transcriptional regulator
VITQEKPVNLEAAERLADIVMLLQRCFMLRLSEQLSKGQVSFPQFFLLGHVGSAEKNLSMSAIAERMNHTTAAATGLVDRLEKLGYVQRATDLSDRRKVFVCITAKGRKLVASIRQDIVQNLQKVMATLTPEEQRMWLQIYEKVFTYVTNKPNSCTE